MSLLTQSDEFKKQVASLLKGFVNEGPFASTIPTQDALQNIQEYREQLEALKAQEKQLRRGLGIFKIDQPPSKEIASLEKVCSL